MVTCASKSSGLKSLSAERTVPVHSQLLQCGFGQYVDSMPGQERLWPALERSASTGRVGSKFSTFFTAARRKHGLYDRLVSFFSLRHNFVSALAEAGLPNERVKLLVGHSQGRDTTMSVYRGRPSVAALHADIELLRYPGLSLRHLHTDQPTPDVDAKGEGSQ